MDFRRACPPGGSLCVACRQVRGATTPRPRARVKPPFVSRLKGRKSQFPRPPSKRDGVRSRTCSRHGSFEGLRPRRDVRPWSPRPDTTHAAPRAQRRHSQGADHGTPSHSGIARAGGTGRRPASGGRMHGLSAHSSEHLARAGASATCGRTGIRLPQPAEPVQHQHAIVIVVEQQRHRLEQLVQHPEQQFRHRIEHVPEQSTVQPAEQQFQYGIEQQLADLATVQLFGLAPVRPRRLVVGAGGTCDWAGGNDPLVEVFDHSTWFGGRARSHRALSNLSGTFGSSRDHGVSRHPDEGRRVSRWDQPSRAWGRDAEKVRPDSRR